jgi:glutathione synthase
MERFIGEGEARRVRERQMGMESLGDADGGLRRTLDHAVSVMSKNSPAVVEGTRLRQKPRSLMEAEEVCSRFVLKPIAAEGGSHCIFGSSIPAFYAEQIAPRSSQAGYVLMQRIHPPVVKGALISQRGYHVGNVVSELGILGGVIFRRTRTGDSKKKGERGAEESELEEQREGASSETRETTTDTVPESSVDIITNEALGWTLKSKSEDIPEMSVIKGYGCFDTPCLVDWETYLAHAREGRKPGVEDIVDRRTEA